MKKIISILGIGILVVLFTGCGVNNIHIHDKVPKNKLALLDTIHDKDDNYITIFKINGRQAGNKWDGPMGDHYVKYGNLTIFVQHHNNSYNTIGATELIFYAEPLKTYEISSYIKDAYIIFNVISDGKIVTTKSIEVRYQGRTSYVPILL